MIRLAALLVLSLSACSTPVIESCAGLLGCAPQCLAGCATDRDAGACTTALHDCEARLDAGTVDAGP